MLTTDDLSLNEYIFQSSPESCSDRSYSTDFMDVTSDEDFLTQLSLDLDIPLYLNPGEDELSLLNSHLDKSPEEILSEFISPSYNMEEDYFKEDKQVKDIDLPTYNLPNIQSSIKSEKSSTSGSEKSPSPIQSDFSIKEEVQIKTPPLSPNSAVVNITATKDVPNNFIYTQPVQILSPQRNTNVQSKQIPIVPKTQLQLQSNQNKIMVFNTDIKPVIPRSQYTKVLLVENVNLKNKYPSINSERVAPLTTSVSVIPNANTINRRFMASTKIDPKILKKQERKIKNRESASLSRKRKKDYLTSLEEQVKELSAVNKRLLVENSVLKQKLTQYENQELKLSKNKAVKPSIFLCMVLLVVGVNLDLIRNPLKFRNQFTVLKSDIPKMMDHHGRNLLWASDDTKSIVNTSDFFPFTMCPAAINQTESARLVLELEKWIGKPERSSKININKNITAPKMKKRKKFKFDGPFISVYRKHRFRNGYQDNLTPSKTAVQIFSRKPEQIFSEFFEAINRQDDTFYVVSFTDQHMLLPALNHNKTRRPKMSLIMPSVLLNDTVSQGSMIPLMQIDCEVLDTRLIHVKHGSIPQHLRTYANLTKEKQSNNFNVSNTDSPKYYKKMYKPYFIKKNSVKSSRDFFNINLN